MFRQANVEEWLGKKPKKEVEALISVCLASVIEMFLGKPDSDGNFTDMERVRKFMSRDMYLGKLLDKKMVVGEGQVSSKIQWDSLIADRYSDIYGKLKDRIHHYTFDEFGEGLIFEMLIVYRSGGYDYLEKDYPSEFAERNIDLDEISFELARAITGRDEFDDIYNAASICVFNDIKNEYRENLEKIMSGKLLPDSEYGFDDCVLNIFYKISSKVRERSMDEITADDIMGCYAAAYTYWLGSFDCYLDDDMCGMVHWLLSFVQNLLVCDDDDYKELESYFDNLLGCMVEHSPVMWDWDYMHILELLNDKNKLDKFLATAGNYMGFVLKDYNKIATGECDMCWDIDEDCD